MSYDDRSFMLVAARTRALSALVFIVTLIAALSVTARARAATRYVAISGTDAGDCTKQDAPCKSIGRAIANMAGGDTLIIGDGTYTEAIGDLPSGTAGAYTTVRAANDWGVLIDGSGFDDSFHEGISIKSKSYVQVRGIRVKMSQDKENNLPVIVANSDHVKLQRCSGSYAPTTGNAATFSIGPASSHVLVEESFAYGGGRYQFLVYQSDHVVVRRSVARSDYWNGSLQCAGFVNYDSLATAWQNDIVLDSDTANCAGHLFGGFFSENKTDAAPDTSQTLSGNIVLNVQAFYAGDLDWVVSGTRTIDNMVIWGSSGGYYADQGPGDPASVTAKHMTIGGITGTYDGPNSGAAHGTGFSVYGSIPNSLTSSLLAECSSLGVADFTSSDYNALSGNGADFGGHHAAVAGAHDLCAANGNAVDAKASLRYLPRIEPSSPLATAGEGGGRIGAEILYAIGAAGSLYDEPGWNTPTSDLLWPFPNEDVIAREMASYAGPGGAGARGFTAGKSLDGTPQTLTKYVWEYLGNPIPADVYAGRAGSPNGPGGEAGGAAGEPSGDADGGGCGCRIGPHLGGAGVPLGALLFFMLVRRRRQRP